jgi:hypothetical protein
MRRRSAGPVRLMRRNLSPFGETGEEGMRFSVVLIGLSTLFVVAGGPVSRAVADVQQTSALRWSTSYTARPQGANECTTPNLCRATVDLRGQSSQTAPSAKRCRTSRVASRRMEWSFRRKEPRKDVLIASPLYVALAESGKAKE